MDLFQEIVRDGPSGNAYANQVNLGPAVKHPSVLCGKLGRLGLRVWSLTRRPASDARLFRLLGLRPGRHRSRRHYADQRGYRAVAARLLGLLSQTMGSLDQAAAHFDDALAFCRKAGYRPELAWTCCDYADMLRERDAEGDRAKAMALLEESLSISSELGMRPLMERVLSRREILRA